MASGMKMIGKVKSKLLDITKDPENFLEVQKKAATQLCQSTKELYDYTKKTESSSPAGGTLPQLLIKNFDDEQIWQELELQNNQCISDLLASIAQISAAKSVDFQTLYGDSEQKSDDDDIDAEDEGEDESLDGDEEEASEDDLVPQFEDSGNEESEEEREMEKLLDEEFKRRKAEGLEDEEDSEDDEMDFDFETGQQMPKKSAKEEDKKDGESQKKVKPRNKRKTIVDDKFFKLAELSEFLDREDRREARRIAQEQGEDVNESSEEDDDEYIDVFQDIPSDGEEIRYDDFFDPPDEEGAPPKKKKPRVDRKHEDDEDGEEEAEEEAESGSEEEEEEEEGENVAEILGGERGKSSEMSSFEKRQNRLKEKISEMEEAALAEKPWQLLGEIAGSSRPENSLLQEHLEYDQATRLAPVITEETTVKLEDLIKQRIKDKAWDDVERKEKPKENAAEYKKRIVLDQEKSKISLSQVYEQEFMRQTQEEEEKEDPQKEEIQKMMTSLFLKLDALSNFHYTPKPAAPDLKIVSNLPSITVEEVAPTTVSEAGQLAPEEIMVKKKDQKGATEKTKTDLKRARREKKKKQKEKHLRREKKDKEIEKLGLSTKYAKDKAKRELGKQSQSSKGVTVLKEDKKKSKSGLTSSKQFFTQLQEEVTSQISAKKAAKKKQDDQPKSAARYKL